MKNTLKVLSVRVFGIIAFIAIFTFSAANCFSQSSGKTINSAEELKKYLDSQPANSKDKPIIVSIGANELMIPKIKEVLNSAGKYVSLNLTGNALTRIPENAFNDEVGFDTVKGCETLVGITIPNGVTIIEFMAFYGCTNLTSVTIPNSVTNIEERVFWNCTSLNNVIIPNSVKSIGGESFRNCTSLTKVTFATGSNITNDSFDENVFPEGNGSNRDYGDTLKIAYSKGKAGTYTRPNGKSNTWTKQ